MVYLTLVKACTSQTAQQEGEQCREDFSENPGRVWYHHLPHVECWLANHQRHIWAAHVQSCQHTVAPVHSKDVNDRLKNEGFHVIWNIFNAVKL